MPEREPEETESKSKLSARLDLVATIFLSIAVVGTAYCAWQSTRWSGVQAIAFAQASSTRIESGKAQSTGTQELAYDATSFIQIALGYSQGTTETAAALKDRLIRKEFAPVLDEWLASDPLNNAKAARNPFEVGYTNANLDKARSLEASASAFYDEALAANQTSDDYILSTVFFAIVLFFGGIVTKIESPMQRVAVMVMEVAALGAGLFEVIRLPFF